MNIIKRFSTVQLILLGFALVILAGTILLIIPAASSEGAFTPPLTALFTSVSATCITGLTLVDTSIYWSSFGKTVILFLIQIGGIGLITATFLFYWLTKQPISPKQRMMFAQTMNLPGQDKIMRYFINMMAFVFGFELAGAALLSVKFIPIFGFWEGIKNSVFHTVSSFCNSGFDFFNGEFSSFKSFSDDYYINIITAILIISGGLGFIVWQNIYRRFRYGENLSVYSKLVLLMSFLLIIFGIIIFYSAERDNLQTMGNGNIPQKILKSFFLSVTMRSAGFANLDFFALTGVSRFLAMLLMFIGGSSGSTAGGIKTVTFAVIMISVIQIIRGNREFNVMKRSIERDTILRAVSLVGICIITIFTVSLLLGLTHNIPFDDVLFETVAAFSNAGAGIGITAGFNIFGKIILMFLMFLGRVGIITMTYSIMVSLNIEKGIISFPKEKLLIG